MPIRVNLDAVLAKCGTGLAELAEKTGLSLAGLSVLKNNRARAVRLSTLEAICRELGCQPGDILEYTKD